MSQPWWCIAWDRTTETFCGCQVRPVKPDDVAAAEARA